MTEQRTPPARGLPTLLALPLGALVTGFGVEALDALDEPFRLADAASNTIVALLATTLFYAVALRR
jgi:hypothetical protein